MEVIEERRERDEGLKAAVDAARQHGLATAYEDWLRRLVLET